LPSTFPGLAGDQGVDTDGDSFPDIVETGSPNAHSGEAGAASGVNISANNPPGYDINCDGSIDSANDFVFADFVASSDLPNQTIPDLYLRIRAMEQEPGSSAGSCTTDTNCQAAPNCQYPVCKATHHCGVASPLILTAPGVACTSNADCGRACATPFCDTRTNLADGTVNPGLNKCSEDPATGHAPDVAGVLASNSVIQTVVDAFANSPAGVRLHVDYSPTALLPHHRVLQMQPCDTCSLVPDGQYYTDVKPLMEPNARDQYAYRFVVFGHSLCRTDGAGNSPTGQSEVWGNDSAVMFGKSLNRFNLADAKQALIVQSALAGTTMHEAGHALALVHYPENNSSTGLPLPSPNYRSVMNYAHQFGMYAILNGTITNPDGTTTTASYTDIPPVVDTSVPPHIDYSNILFADTLVESNLFEFNGIKAGGSGSNDLVPFYCPSAQCNTATGAGCFNHGWANGGSVSGSGIDWSCNASIDTAGVASPIDGTGATTNTLPGFGGSTGNEWTSAVQFGFLCQPTFANGASLPTDRITQGEVSAEFAASQHLLSGPPRTLGSVGGSHGPGGTPGNAIVRFGCTNPWIDITSTAAINVAVLGSASLDVTTIDVTTLSFAGTAPFATSYDVNADGFLDLDMTFKQNLTNLAVGNTTATVSGSFFNGQLFSAPAAVLVTVGGVDPNGGTCH
jgi:hypothetical protein